MSHFDQHDEMFPVFGPLLAELNAGLEKSILVAGGYGLYLKQSWLLANPVAPVIVPISQWINNTPRVTKDLDLVVGLDLISDANAQTEILHVIEKHGFKVSETNPRWQFSKEISETRNVILELHAQRPTAHQCLQSDRIRIKRKPSLGTRGVHARTNPEAIGSVLRPFRFEVQGIAVQVPNHITWAIMKLTAADDRWKQSVAALNSEEMRAYARMQALKHAQDVFRLVAMVSRDERDATPEIISELKTLPEFEKAALIVEHNFTEDQQWVSQMLSDHWNSESFALMRSVLRAWFNQDA